MLLLRMSVLVLFLCLHLVLLYVLVRLFVIANNCGYEINEFFESEFALGVQFPVNEDWRGGRGGRRGK